MFESGWETSRGACLSEWETSRGACLRVGGETSRGACLRVGGKHLEEHV